VEVISSRPLAKELSDSQLYPLNFNIKNKIPVFPFQNLMFSNAVSFGFMWHAEKDGS